jgi:hypothetical protein
MNVQLLQCSRIARADRDRPKSNQAKDGTQINRRGPGPLRGTSSRSARGPCGGGWRGLTPQWPRSLRLGSASRFNLRLLRGPVKSGRVVLPAHSGKVVEMRSESHGRNDPKAVEHNLRLRLARLPQCSYGHRAAPHERAPIR